MPPTIVERLPKLPTALAMRDIDFDYQYPLDDDGNELNLKPGSELHNRIVGMVNRIALESHAEISKRYDSWDEVNRVLTAFIVQDDEELRVRDRDERKITSFVLPMSYVVMETILTHLMSAFLSGPELFRYVGTGPEDEVGAIMLTKVIEAQMKRSKVRLALRTAFRDGLAFGMGVVAPVWVSEFGPRTFMREEFAPGGILEGQERVTEVEEGLIWEGNSLNNVNPFSLLPDPNVSIQNIQQGDFIGWVDRTTFLSLFDTEGQGEGELFNVRFLTKMIEGRSFLFENVDPAKDRFGMGDEGRITPIAPIDVITLYMTIIPRDVGVGDSELPEKWMFAVAGDSVLIGAQRLGLDHNQYPVAVGAPTFDGYSTAPVSPVEMNSGLQKGVNALYNMHITSVRKLLNGMFVLDPTMINVNDFLNPLNGFAVRLKKRAFGTDIKQAIHQIPVQDPTANNIVDVGFMISFMERVMGAPEGLQGITRQGPERLTLGEAQQIQASALSRTGMIARVLSEMLLRDVGRQFAANTVQFMSQEMFVRITGESDKRLMAEYNIPMDDRGRIVVNPLALSAQHDIEVMDETMPGGRSLEALTQAFQTAASIPEIGQRVDLHRIFLSIMREAGLPDIGEFERPQAGQTQILPDEEIIKQQERGNIVPIQQPAVPGAGVAV